MRSEPGSLADLVLGVIGAFVGGATFNYFGNTGMTGFNFWSLFVAVVGAIVVLVIYRLVTRAV